MNESFKKIIDEYKTVPPAKKLLINALKEIKPDKKNWGVWVYSGILALVLSIGIGFHEETVEVFRNVIEIFLTIQIAVFGVLFTVYSILLSFLNNDFMKLLANSPESDGKSQLRVCTEYFESVLFLYGKYCCADALTRPLTWLWNFTSAFGRCKMICTSSCSLTQ